jgi:hypothetical protein
VDNVPLWKDVSPRLGASYDLFGNGKTAIKGFVGRYVLSQASDIAANTNPALAIVNTATRTWADANGDYVPQSNELGPLSNSLFGTLQVNTTYDPSVLTANRPYNWQASASVDHELMPGVGVTVGYFRTWYGNFMVTDNQKVGAADFNSYCVTAPTNTNLPNGGGYPVCGLFDVTPAKFGQVSNLVTQASQFGGMSEIYNGVDISFKARFHGRGFVGGGVSTATTTIDYCNIAKAHPDVSATASLVAPFTTTAINFGPSWPVDFCRVEVPWSGNTQVKINGAYPLPWFGLEASGVLQNVSGPPRAANYVASNALIAPSLGRDLAACGGRTPCTATVTAPVATPNFDFESRLNQLDARLAKTWKVGSTRLQGTFDVYNALNASTILSVNGTYGGSWLRPTTVLAGRIFKFGGQLDF